MNSDQQNEIEKPQVALPSEPVEENFGGSDLLVENKIVTSDTAEPPRILSEKADSSPRPKGESVKIIWATGRRKSAIAQVKMVLKEKGTKVFINGEGVDSYFKGNKKQALSALQSLNAVSGFSGYKLFIKVHGGGITGQAESIRHGIARALSQWNQELKVQMRKEGFLTRDPRATERKKPGQPKARKRFQYSKR